MGVLLQGGVAEGAATAKSRPAGTTLRVGGACRKGRGWTGGAGCRLRDPSLPSWQALRRKAPGALAVASPRYWATALPSPQLPGRCAFPIGGSTPATRAAPSNGLDRKVSTGSRRPRGGDERFSPPRSGRRWGSRLSAHPSAALSDHLPPPASPPSRSAAVRASIPPHPILPSPSPAPRPPPQPLSSHPNVRPAVGASGTAAGARRRESSACLLGRHVRDGGRAALP